MPQREPLAPRASLATLSRGAFALGVRRAVTGPVQVAALVVGGVTTLVGTGVCAAVARSSGEPSVAYATSLTAGALAWGAGLMLAASGASRAWTRDREDGVYSLARARGATPAAYVVARTLGLAALLALVVGGGTLVCGLVGLAASQARGVAPALGGLAASLVYAALYAVVLASVAMAALGARTRVGGYFALVALLLIPDLVARGVAEALAPSARDFLSLPGALAALRGGLLGGELDGVRAARGLFVIALVSAVSLAVAIRDLQRAEREVPS